MSKQSKVQSPQVIQCNDDLEVIIARLGKGEQEPETKQLLALLTAVKWLHDHGVAVELSTRLGRLNMVLKEAA